MKYIWELLILAKQQGIEEKSITFCYPQHFSPYMELSFENLNDALPLAEVDVNPYYRFYSIFKDYFLPDDNDDQEIKAILYDLILHYLGNLERYRGMTKRDYYIEFVQQDIENGLLGESVRQDFSALMSGEKSIVAENLLRLYKTGEGVFLFLDTVRKLFKKAVIYANAKEKDIIFLYLNVKETQDQVQKINLLKAIFLPFKYEMEIYWEYMFGVIGEDAWMHQEEMVIYSSEQ